MLKNTEEIKLLARGAIIALATDYVKEHHADLQINVIDFDISVWANSIKVIVKFNRKVHYTPLRFKGTEPPFYSSHISFNLTVEIISPTECKLDTWFIKDFFVPSPEDLENLAFIEKHFGLHQEHFNTGVTEEVTHFSIRVDNEVAFGRYFIDKGTGKQSIPPIQGSYSPNPFPDFGQEEDPNVMLEIK